MIGSLDCHAIINEYRTCISENFTSEYNKTAKTSGTVDDFLKSSPSDNTILAEIVCQDQI